jgi:type I restriction enzyme R subunit
MFDPSIDNEGGGSLEKEDGIVEMLEDYNNRFSQSFTIPTYDKFRKDVSLRLAHKKPYERITQDDQIDILIVVNQMLTGFDSKWVNTLYLDKVMEYENLIQAFSRTNRLFNVADKPFGIIKYYRRPNTMEKNIEAAVKAYSGDIPTGLFVDKLPNNLRQMNYLFDEMDTLFKNAGISDFDRLPDEISVKAKFAKQFKQFSTHLEAATIQGFIWSQQTYNDENGLSIVMHFDEMTYLILLARYKELAKGGGGGRGGDIPYEIDTHITEYDTEKIDADYMNSRFEKFMKLIQSEYDAESFEKTLKELHKSFSMLSQEEQKYANIFVHDIQAGNINVIPGKSFREYISEMMKKAENDRIKTVAKRLGCYEKLLRELLERKVTKETIEAHGKFEELKATVDKQKARTFFILVEGSNYQESRLAMYIEQYLRQFLLSGGQDPYAYIYPNVEHSEVIREKEESEDSTRVGVTLIEEKMVGKSVISSLKSTTLNNWYSESKALACMLETDCFAYVENKLCIYDNKYIQRDGNGRMFLTSYAKEHEEECFLQFIIDDETGELHYVTLPAAMASKSFNYYDEINEELLTRYGLVNEISNEMLLAINGLEFCGALTKLMSKNICNYSVRLLKDTTGLDNRTISNMKKGDNLTKLNVISACLGIHIPYRVSNKMLQLAELTLNLELPGKKGDENGIYNTILHLKWATDYEDIYEELKEQSYEYLIHRPK